MFVDAPDVEHETGSGLTEEFLDSCVHGKRDEQERLVPRPRGRPPAGKVWNGHTGAWVWCEDVGFDERERLEAAQQARREASERQRRAAKVVADAATDAATARGAR